MTELELRTLIENECGINVPDRCVGCAKLGALAASLSKEYDTVATIGVTADVDLLFSVYVRPFVIESLTEQYPYETAEQIEMRAQEGLARFKASEDSSEFLMTEGAFLEKHETSRDELVDQIKTLLEACPPEGHTASR